ncbi:MAG: phenylalanine--tRNA ligase subunit alpha [Candidatus Thermoplasmatota archaeon]
MSDLSLAEARLLLALKAGARNAAQVDGFASESEALVAADRPIRLGLVQVEESASTRAELTPEGRRVRDEGLPERRVVRVLAGKPPVALDQLASLGVPAGDVQVAVGWLRRKNWAKVEKGPSGTMLSATSEPAQDEQETALRDPAKASGKTLADLAARGLVVLKESKTRTLTLTPTGTTRASQLAPDAGSGIEVNQVTPELLAKWPTMTAAEKAKTRLRPFDFGVPVAVPAPGKPHPLTHIITEIRQIFWGMGFTEIAGDYVESAHWNMDALFIPQDHPARDMQDTFYLAEPASLTVSKADLERVAAVHQTGGATGSTGWGGLFDDAVSQKALLRTHTTNTTIRHLAAHPKEPVKAFGLGRVFRKETMDATHLPEFTQIEGIVTEPGATFDTLIGLCRHFFARMGFPEVRFRPAYFPYTEPSMEIDVFYNGRWMELGGCGIFRPEVTKPLGVRDNVVAWGFGLERLAMMRLGLKDIRDLYISDIEWLRTAPMR